MKKIDAFSQITTKDLLTDEERILINLKKKLFEISLNEKLRFNLGRKDKNGNPSNRNLGLVRFISSCGYDYKEYIRSYLRSLQPFMIIPEQNRTTNYFSCTIDASYRIPLWIECYYNENNEQVISFHELNRFSKAYDNLYLKRKELLIQPTLRPDNVELGERSLFRCNLTRGLKNFEIELVGTKVADEYVRVTLSEFENRMLEVCNGMLENLYEQVDSDSFLNASFSSPKQVSFSSYGDMLQSQVSLLLDLFASKKMKNDSITILLNSKICEMKQLSNYQELGEYFYSKYSNWSGVDFSGLFLTVERDM